MREQTTKAELFILSPNRRSDRRADAKMENLMSDARTKIPDHYNAVGLIDRVKVMLEAIAPENQQLTISQLAPVDHFHVRGILATADLAVAAQLSPSMRVLDLGCGIGGTARYLAGTVGCTVVGVDLSPGFVEVATFLTARCGLGFRKPVSLSAL